MEWPAKRCYVGLVAVGVQEQAEDIQVCSAAVTKLFDFIIISFPSHHFHQNSGPCDSFYCNLGHSKNVYDDDDDDDDVAKTAQRIDSQPYAKLHNNIPRTASQPLRNCVTFSRATLSCLTFSASLTVCLLHASVYTAAYGLKDLSYCNPVQTECQLTSHRCKILLR